MCGGIIARSQTNEGLPIFFFPNTSSRNTTEYLKQVISYFYFHGDLLQMRFIVYSFTNGSWMNSFTAALTPVIFTATLTPVIFITLLLLIYTKQRCKAIIKFNLNCVALHD